MLTNDKKKNIIYMCVLLLLIGIAIISVASLVKIRSKRNNVLFWNKTPVEISQTGFMMMDISDLVIEKEEEEFNTSDYEYIPISTGFLPSIVSLTEEELKLYSLLSKTDGVITEKEKEILDEDTHWQEYVLNEDDTIETVAEHFGIELKKLKYANIIGANDKVSTGDVIYIPDSDEYVLKTREFLTNERKEELEELKKVRPVETFTYTVAQGDSLWSIANKYNLDVDTIIGSNQLKNINMLKLGTELRIPNQNGIFVRLGKNVKIGKLADKHGATLKDVIVANNIEDVTSIKEGTELFLPGGKIVEVTRTDNRRDVARNKFREKTRKVYKTVGHGYFSWPTVGRISSPFGWRRNPFGGRRRRFHAGLDIAAPKGRRIIAPADGRVVYSGWMRGYGKTVVLSHANGLSTLYGHCSELEVSKGMYIKKGQVIARVGSTGQSTGNHLHFEVRVNGRLTNPIQFLR